MLHWLRRIRPATWRAYAQALVARSATDEWPSAAVLRRVAADEGADVGALLVLTRYELPAADDPDVTVPLDEPRGAHPEVRVDSLETVHALLAADRQIFPWLRGPNGRDLPRQLARLQLHAEAWAA